MTTRLRWNQAGLDHGGAFVLRDAPLYLLVSASGELDRLHQDPESRAGFVAESSDRGSIKLSGRGGLGFLVDGKVRDIAEVKFGHNVICSFEDQQWSLQAEGDAPVVDPLVGTDLGGYRIVDRLGNGSVGVVYRAIQINLDREVALKILDPKAAKKSPLAVASFKREAVAAGRLSHPNLVQVYDVGFERGLHFFAMELVPGGDLEQLLEEKGSLPWREAFVFMLDCVEALRFAREHKLVHRDIKPENLMLTIDGRTKLADLGMAATRGMVEAQAAGGTPHFMAPECVSGEHIDFRSDFYSLGCTLFRLLTGKTPYQGESVRDILRSHRDSLIPSLKEHGVDAPAAVQEVLEWLMAKNPDDRPASADEIAEEIQALLEVKKSNNLLLGVLALAVVAVGVSLYSVLTSEKGPVIVEVESPDAQEERDRNARLEVEVAFTRAMAVAEGADREAALMEFLSQNPESEFRMQALDELERLGDLPEPGTPNTESNDPVVDAAAEARRLALAELETSLQSLLKQQKYGEAQASLAASSLSADLLVPLWSRVDNSSKDAAFAWKTEHASLLSAEKWTEAASLRDQFAAAMNGAVRGVSEWQHQVDDLASAAVVAEQTALEKAFEGTRLAAVEALQDGALAAVERMDFAAAVASLEQAAADCAHPGLAQAIAARSELFTSAQRAMEQVFARLNASEQIQITEPIGGKRAYATEANPDGVTIMIQVNGERVARTDPWSAFLYPQAFSTFLDQVLGPAKDGNLPDRQALQLLIAEASLARHLQAWGQAPPSAAAANNVVLAVSGWLDVLQTSEAMAEPMQSEWMALQQMLELSEALAGSDAYDALLHARGLGEHFSLLSAWSSNGASFWGFTP
ncbi:MAG: serine/threonine protein kinase [Planctomycetes bacterium]|nr:serine/threonine protein kinase [Planctomycetota bacterium]MCP4860175.1 serine/threonine protein kinase [Planctomycetota bacterium]